MCNQDVELKQHISNVVVKMVHWKDPFFIHFIIRNKIMQRKKKQQEKSEVLL